MRIGIDSYSYHRLLGDVRAGEVAPALHWGPLEAVRHARTLDVDGVSLETTFLGPAAGLDVSALREAAGPLELVLAWGHPHGLEFGASDAALDDLLAWLELAPGLGCGLVRCVAASPGFRGRPFLPAVEPLARATRRARELGLRLAIENHGDLAAADLLELVERVGDEALGVCFDSANALRMGDEPVSAARLLGPSTLMVHLKDVEPMANVVDPVAGPCSVPFGEGVVDVRGVLAALDGAGFDGLVCVELGQLAPGADELELVEAGVAWLRAYASAASNG